MTKTNIAELDRPKVNASKPGMQDSFECNNL